MKPPPKVAVAKRPTEKRTNMQQATAGYEEESGADTDVNSHDNSDSEEDSIANYTTAEPLKEVYIKKEGESLKQSAAKREQKSQKNEEQERKVRVMITNENRKVVATN